MSRSSTSQCSIKRLRKLAADMEVVPGLIQQREAIQRLRPDLSERIDAGTLTIKQAQPGVYPVFVDILKQQIGADDDFVVDLDALWKAS